MSSQLITLFACLGERYRIYIIKKVGTQTFPNVNCQHESKIPLWVVTRQWKYYWFSLSEKEYGCWIHVWSLLVISYQSQIANATFCLKLRHQTILGIPDSFLQNWKSIHRPHIWCGQSWLVDHKGIGVTKHS